MKCQHKHVLYTEMTPRYGTHVFEDGALVDSWDADYGDISRIVEVKCGDCGLEKSFNLSHKSCPEWVKAMDRRLFEMRESDQERVHKKWQNIS